MTSITIRFSVNTLIIIIMLIDNVIAQQPRDDIIPVNSSLVL